jgi:hypothetical protein
MSAQVGGAIAKAPLAMPSKTASRRPRDDTATCVPRIHLALRSRMVQGNRSVPMSNLTTHAKSVIDRCPITVRRALKRAHYARQIRHRQFYSDEPELRLALELLQPGDWVIDVGANVGHYTLPLARRVGPAGRVVAL